MTQDIFNWLVKYHCDKNLEKCLPFIENGRVRSPDSSNLREGLDENEIYPGVLVVCNGDTLLETLMKDEIVDPNDIDGFVEVKGWQDFIKYLGSRENNDGAYIFDSKNSRITRAYELNNHPKTLKGRYRLEEMVPGDFCSADGSVSPRSNLGTKTRLAIKLPQAYPNITTFQIKRTPYGDFGMGKVTYFDKDGLRKEFFLTSHEEGIYRSYERMEPDGRMEKVGEAQIPLEVYATKKMV